jgi:hypothetical protein
MKWGKWRTPLIESTPQINLSSETNNRTLVFPGGFEEITVDNH